MKKFLIALLAIFMSGTAWADTGRDGDLQPAVVNVAAHYLDNLCMDVLAMLRIAAVSPEAKRGDWPGIKAYLRRANERVPGVYFHVLPDGNYYSLDKDFTNLNLADRGYFKSLFEGVPTRGYEIYSRSSGRKSAVMAAPIMIDGRVAGALGASIFLDELHRRFNAEMGLPEGYTWFVVNRDGLVMLDMDSDFIFMNALTEGNASLRQSMARALQGESGHIEYEVGGAVRKAVYRKLPNLDWWMILAKKEGKDERASARLDISLKTLVPALQASLSSISDNGAKLLAETGIGWDDEAEIRGVLGAALAVSPFIVDAAFVDAKGVLRHVEPRDYVNFEGADISAQAHVKAQRQHPVPIFSSGFTAVEDYLAVVVAFPVFDGTGRFKGSVTLLIRPELMLRALLRQVRIPADRELWIMQTDGMIIYDDDPREVGKNLFTDPIYAGYDSLLKLGGRISAQPRGEGDYVYQALGHRNKVVKTASWDTVSLFGRDWRVVLAQPAK